MTTRRPAVNKAPGKDRDKAKALLQTISLVRQPVLVHLIQQLDDLRHRRLLSAVERLDQARLTLQDHRAISHPLQPAVVAIQVLRRQVDRPIRAQLKQEAPLATSHPVQPSTRALKALTQAPELPFHLPMCHRRRTDRHNKVASPPKPTLPTQPPEHRKRQTETTCRRDEDKVMQPCISN